MTGRQPANRNHGDRETELVVCDTVMVLKHFQGKNLQYQGHNPLPPYKVASGGRNGGDPPADDGGMPCMIREYVWVSSRGTSSAASTGTQTAVRLKKTAKGEAGRETSRYKGRESREILPSFLSNAMTSSFIQTSKNNAFCVEFHFDERTSKSTQAAGRQRKATRDDTSLGSATRFIGVLDTTLSKYSSFSNNCTKVNNLVIENSIWSIH
ncbi:hypothetical protein LXL04_035054 [Taraxacum kok-saghyz]